MPARPTFSPGFPDYLADLRGPLRPAVQSAMQKWDISLAVGGLNLNGKTFAEGEFLETFDVGRVVEFSVNPSNPNGDANHPLHVHVWPFQITALPEATPAAEYFKVGDFHDTIQLGLEAAYVQHAVAVHRKRGGRGKRARAWARGCGCVRRAVF